MIKSLSAALLVVFSCGIFAQDYSIASIPESLLAGANAIVREKSEDYVLKSVSDLQINESEVITILNAAGEKYSTIFIPYSPTANVSNIKVEVFDAFGKSIKSYGKKDFSDYTNNPSAALYVDDRVLVFKPISTKYPYTIKTSYETNTSNTVYLSNFRPVYAYNLAIQKSAFSVLNKSGIKIRTKINDKPIAKVNYSEEGNLWKYSYENIPAIVEENFSPSLDYLVPTVEFSPEKFTLEKNQGDMTDWNTFGKWYYQKLIAPVSVVTPEITAEVNALHLTGTTSEKVKTIYQYMQNKTRYVLIAMGIGGWQPMPASEVSKKGYGDCKALTNYMRTLLNAAGIPAYFAVINEGESSMMYDKNFPKLSGNHAILVVPTEKGNLWLENTQQDMAFNHLRYSTHNRNVLAIKENGIELINTPMYTAEESREKLLAKVVLTEDGSLVSDANFSFSGGQYDQNLRIFGLKSDEIQEVMKNRNYHLKIDQLDVKNLKNDKNEGKISYDMKLQANNYCKKLGNDMFFPVMPFYQSATYTENEERKLPFETPFPFQDDYEIEFTIPKGYKIAELPSPSEISSEFGDYSIAYTQKDDKLLVHRILTIKKGIYPKEKFKDYVAFRKKTKSNDNTKVLITKL